MIEIKSLGPPVVTVDGARPPAELLWRKHLALLVYLARSPRGRTRDHLVGLLWPEKEEAKARHSLNEALRVIRSVAGDGLVTEGDTVRLQSSSVAIDADDPERGAIKGVFLEGFGLSDAPAFEDWLAGERQKHSAVSLARLVTDAEAAVAVGELAVGRGLAEDALLIEPLHEPATRVLMRAHALEGSRTLALEVYDRLTNLLQRELSLEPGGDTRALAERIRTERIVRGAPAVEGVPHDVVPLVGPGHAALERCLLVWQQAVQGAPGVIVLQGEPGTGKTRLADEVAARARLDGAVVSQTRVLEDDGVEQVWSALLRGGLDVPELGGAAPQVLAALGRLEPDILVRFPAARAANPVGVAEPFQQAVIAVAEVRPVLIVMDDAHRATAAVIEAFGGLVQRAGTARVCLLLTAAAGPEARWLDALSQRVGRDVEGAVVSTAAFGADDVAELVMWAFPEYDSEAVDRLRRRVMVETAGIPFLAVEFVRAVRSGLKVRDTASPAAWPDKFRTLDHTLPGSLPESVAAALRLRFRGLTDDARAMLTAVAVVGGGALVGRLARAAAVPVERAERALDELEWQRWLVGDAHGYAFVTKLAGEIVLADMVTAGQKHRMLERAGGREE